MRVRCQFTTFTLTLTARHAHTHTHIHAHHAHACFCVLRSHFAKFVPRGSRRVRLHTTAHADTPSPAGGGGGDGGVYNFSGAIVYGACPPGPPRAVALKRPDGELAVVVLHCGDSPVEVRLVLGASGRALQRSMPPHSIHTYLIKR